MLIMFSPVPGAGGIFRYCPRSTVQAGCSLPDKQSFSFVTFRDQIIFYSCYLHKFITFSSLKKIGSL